MIQSRFCATALAAVLCFLLASQQPSRADPAVQGIAAAGIVLMAYSVVFNSPEDKEPDVVTHGIGGFDIVDHVDTAALFRIEYRPGIWKWRTGPLFGIAATTDGGGYAYAGLRYDVPFGKRLLISANFSIAGYHQGGGKILAGPGLFRSGLDFFYRFDNGTRLGASFHHLSHAELMDDFNPGTETVAVTYTIPFDRL